MNLIIMTHYFLKALTYYTLAGRSIYIILYVHTDLVPEHSQSLWMLKDI